jgi:exopolyphosphatase/guanosine-5'-triphosphate,3'-diphosphate pyrophosphatase
MSPEQSALDNVESREASKVAALDIGSNSFHLVVARIVAGSVQIVHRVKQKVRLAEGLDDKNILSQEAIDRGIECLKVVAESLKGFEPDSVRIVATHTLRRARNANAFINAAIDVLPYTVEVISGTEEARLIYSGVAHTNHDDGRRLVIDIGGGSTEFVIGEGLDPLICRSLQMGCVSYTQRFFSSGEIKAKAFDKAITAAEQEMELIEGKYGKLGWQQCIGTSGTIRTLFNLAQQNKDVSHDLPVTLKGLKALMRQFIDAGHVDNLGDLAINEDRQGVIAGGLAILIGIFKALNIEELMYSPSALREGVIYEMEAELYHADIRSRTAKSLVTRYDVDTTQANMVLSTTQNLFQQCQKDWKLKHPDFSAMLSWAALLHEVGLQINSRGVQRHSAYILQNVDLPGFNQEQQELLATIVRYHRKKIRPQEFPSFYQYNNDSLIRLIMILRLGVLLNIKRQENFIPDFTMTTQGNIISLTFPEDWLTTHPIIHADLQRESHYLKAVNYELKVI